MNPKSTLMLVVALLVAVGGLWWAQSSNVQPDATDDNKPRKLFEVEFDKIVGFEVKPHDAPTCSFVKEKDKWRMTAPMSGPAEQGTLTSDIRRVANLEYVKKFEKGAADFPEASDTTIDKPKLVFKLTDDAGKSHVLKVGQAQTLSRRTFVQPGGDEAVYLVDGDLARDLRRKPSAYRSKRISDMNRMDVTRIEVQGEQNYTVVKDTRGWTIESPVKARAEVATVNKILQGMESLTALEFVDDAPASLRPYGLEKPRYLITVTSERKTVRPPPPPPATQPETPEFDTETKVVRVAFGGKAETSVFAKLAEDGSPTVFQISETVLKNVVPAIDDLREKRIVNMVSSKAQRIKLKTPSDSVELIKQASGWRFAPSDTGLEGDAADAMAIDDVLKAVRELKALGFETGEPNQYGLAEPEIRIEVTLEGQIEPVELHVGGPTPSKTGTYVRNVREDFIAVVAAESVEPLRVQPTAFLSRELMSFDVAQVTRIDIERPGTPCSLEQSAGEWRFAAPVQGVCEQQPADALAGELSRLRGRRVVAKADRAADYGLTAPAYRISVTIQPPKPPPAADATVEQATVPDPEPVTYAIALSEQGGKTYAMRIPGVTICEVDAKVLNDARAEFLDCRVFDIEPSQVTALGVTATASFRFSKQGDRWVLAGEESFPSDAKKITDYLTELKNLRLHRYAAYQNADLEQHGLIKPLFEVAVTRPDGSVTSLAVSSAGPADGGSYANLSTSPDRVFVLKPDVVTKLKKAVTDFRSGA